MSSTVIVMVVSPGSSVAPSGQGPASVPPVVVTVPPLPLLLALTDDKPPLLPPAPTSPVLLDPVVVAPSPLALPAFVVAPITVPPDVVGPSAPLLVVAPVVAREPVVIVLVVTETLDCVACAADPLVSVSPGAAESDEHAPHHSGTARATKGRTIRDCVWRFDIVAS
ncbi:MAG TPA: hypothetical protein VFU02_12570 [Polyangiaceae bacterium]|nr:hypothetical protein [Polyangiaceae bacterium]